MNNHMSADTINRELEGPTIIKFLLTGTYSSFNKGDAAMQLATAQALRDEWPDATITISTPFPQYDDELYREFEIVKCHRRNLVFGTLQLGLSWLYRQLRRVDVTVSFLLVSTEQRATNEADVVVDLSGDTITEDYGPHVTYSHLLPILLAQTLERPVYLSGQSVGPFKLTKRLVRRVLSNCAGVTAREQVTYDYLRELGIPQNILSLESDMAFLLKPINEASAKQILADEKVDTNRPLLGVTVSDIIKSRFESNSTTNFNTFFANVLDTFVAQHDTNILFVGHVTGPDDNKDDRQTARGVQNEMEHSNQAFVLNGDYTPMQLKGVISQCSLFLGSRMHSNIGAISTHVPTVALSYSHKTIGIMNSAGQQDHVLDGGKLTKETLLKELNEIAEDAKKITRQLKERIPEIKQSSAKNIGNIKSIVERNG